jgi:hypothetical protein
MNVSGTLRKVAVMLAVLPILACTSSKTAAPAGSTKAEASSSFQTLAKGDGREEDTRTGRVRASGRALRDNQGETFALGVTMMWAVWAYKNDRAWLERNLEYLSSNGFDYIRALGVISRNPASPGDYWYRLDMNSSIPDYDQVIAGITDLAYDKYGMRVEWTIFGGAADFNESQKQSLIDRFLSMSRGREHKIIHFEIANEYEGTGWRGDSSIRNWTRYLNDRTDILVAASAAYQETNDLCAEFQALYAGGIADIGTWHFDREVRLGDGYWRPVRQPWEYPYCTGLPIIGSNNEPLGPGASVNSDDDPMTNVSGAIVTYISGLPLHVFHSEAGVRADRGDYTQYKTEVNSAFRAMKRYMPRNITNWSRQNHHWSGHPFNTLGEVGYPTATGSGAVRNYGAVNGNEFVTFPMGIRDYVRLQAKSEMSFCVIHPLTGKTLSKHYLRGGESVDLRGLEAFFVRGRLGNSGDGCGNYENPAVGAASLKAGQSLSVGQSLKSRNGEYELNYQGDNNLVLYAKGQPLWASNTAGLPSPKSVEMQGDGNLVIYDGSGSPIWASNTSDKPGVLLVLENSGRLALIDKDAKPVRVFYAPPVTLKAGQFLPVNGQLKSTNPVCELNYQGDNHLVLYLNGQPLWASGTVDNGQPGSVQMQGDGNLVMYDSNGRPIWATDTSGNPGAYLALNGSCRLVMVKGDGSLLKEIHQGQP